MNFQTLSTMFACLFGFLGSSSRYSNMAVCLKAACKTEVVISLQHILKRSLSRSCANRVDKESPSEYNKLTKTQDKPQDQEPLRTLSISADSMLFLETRAHIDISTSRPPPCHPTRCEQHKGIQMVCIPRRLSLQNLYI